MAQFRTHYDNLKIARNAPPEVVGAAYRALSRRLHPDTNTHPDATKFMAIVNASYAVLSDPARRAEHDRWIDLQSRPEHRPVEGVATDSRKGPGPRITSLVRITQNFGLILTVGAFALWALLSPSAPPQASNLPAYDRSAETEVGIATAIDEPSFVRPLKAPNGEPWPSSASYVAGYKRLRTDGLSQLTVDNSSDGSDMFVKLVAIDVNKTVPIRHFYLPKGSTFILENIRRGMYDLRYMDLEDGSLTRSDNFELQQAEDAGGTTYSRSTMTLYKVAGGNIQSYRLRPDEF